MNTGNFNSATAIIYALKCPSVLIWWDAWQLLPKKYFQSLRLMDYNLNEKYWETVDQSPKYILPYIASYMYDLQHIINETPVIIKDGQNNSYQTQNINFIKFYQTYGVSSELKRLLNANNIDVTTIKDDSLSNFLKHIHKYSIQNFNEAIGLDVNFALGKIPKSYTYLNTDAGQANMKKIRSKILKEMVNNPKK
jgi:hypothetical protein